MTGQDQRAHALAECFVKIAITPPYDLRLAIVLSVCAVWNEQYVGKVSSARAENTTCRPHHFLLRRSLTEHLAYVCGDVGPIGRSSAEIDIAEAVGDPVANRSRGKARNPGAHDGAQNTQQVSEFVPFFTPEYRPLSSEPTPLPSPDCRGRSDGRARFLRRRSR